MNLEIGQIVDGYEIVGVLGRGGMGVVYEAVDTSLSRTVALKAINPGLTQDEQFVKRFQSEARILAQVHSPYIVGIHALRQTEYGLFIVMEYVSGGTVADLLVDTGMDLDQSLPIIKQMLDAFEHAHNAGIIHRDIKPANIMLSEEGIVKVADFGLAKQNQDDMMATVTQGVMGTLHYMSPEQVRGMGDVDHRSDLFSVGMTMYQMLAGRLPFEKTDGEFAIMRSIVDDEFPRPDVFNPEIPSAFADIIVKLTAKEKDDRYQSAGEVLAAILAFEGPVVPSAKTPKKAVTAATVKRPKHATNSADGTKTQTRSRSKTGIFVGVAAVVALVVWQVILPIFTSNSVEIIPPAVGLLNVETVPSQAIIAIDGNQIGQSPLAEFEIENSTGSVAVLISKAGFVAIDTSLTLGITHTIELNAVIIQDAAQDAAQNEEQPRTKQASEFTASELAEATRRFEESRLGTVVPSADASGFVYIDDELVTSGSPLKLEAGSHVMRATHVLLGELTHEFSIEAGQTQEINCFFQGKVNVSSGQIWGTIWVNDRATEYTTPGELNLGPGTYSVSVRKFGYDTELVEGSPEPIVFTGSCEAQESVRLVFSLTAQS